MNLDGSYTETRYIDLQELRLPEASIKQVDLYPLMFSLVKSGLQRSLIIDNRNAIIDGAMLAQALAAYQSYSKRFPLGEFGTPPEGIFVRDGKWMIPCVTIIRPEGDEYE